MKKFLFMLNLVVLGLFCGSMIYALDKNLFNIKSICTLPHVNNTEEESTSTYTNTKTTDNVVIQENSNKINAFTGEYISNESGGFTPFFCIIENSVNARPQSGLSDADIVYETLAEGGIPRFLALFYSNSPEKIGPVRSIRPYFIDLTTEYNIPFAHCGGSAEALATITSNNTLQSINEIAQPAPFWRDTARKAPHNLYTSSENIRTFINENNLMPSSNRIFNFNNSYWDSEELMQASTINLNPSKTYSTSYKYQDGKYTKYMDGVLSIDKNQNNSITFKNVVIQKTKINLHSDGSHININLVGSGDGYLFSNGKAEKILWRKDTKSSPTLIENISGEEIPLSVGNTIWHIVDTNSKMTFE